MSLQSWQAYIIYAMAPCHAMLPIVCTVCSALGLITQICLVMDMTAGQIISS